MPDIEMYLPNSDENTLQFAKNIARAYGAIGQLSEADVEQAESSDDLTVVNDIISKVPELTEEKRQEFCESFIGDDENFNAATPAILAGAYRALASRAEDGDTAAQEKLARLDARIDEMSADLANSGGMIVDNGVSYPVVDMNNVADVYAGMVDMLNARKENLDKENDAEKIAEIDKNLEYLNARIFEYDNHWGIFNLNEKKASQLEAHWEDVNDAVGHAELSNNTKTLVSKFKFLDAENKVIPQYVDAEGKEYADYAADRTMIKDGRLASMVEFARHDVVKKHAAKIDEEIDENALEQEVNDELLFKLYETSMADKVVQGAIDDPDQFTDPRKRDAILKEISENGGMISDAGYTAAVDAHCNSTAGWAARVKAKLGRGAQKVGHFFDRVFKPVERVDRMKNVRMTNVSKSSKRVEMMKRILKGFASAFVASALITTIATAAAAVAGVSIAMSFAVIGIVTGIGMAALQIRRWRAARMARGEPTGIKDLLADKRLVSSLGVSAIAAIAMCFGAAGMAQAAQALGFGALAIGGTKNALEAFKDARASNMGRAESIAWAIANAGAVIAGGFAGRMAANTAINAYNEHNPENEIFQNKETIDTRHTETRTEYSQDALDNAEKIAKMWYKDNPALLQQRVEAINNYNATHGTNIDPYRAIMINGDAGGQTFDNMQLHVNNSHVDPNIDDVYSHGNHRVMTDAWGQAHGYSHDDLVAARNLFNTDGTINQTGMDVVARLDHNVSVTNTIGHVEGRPVHTDGYFKPNDPDGWTTYTGGKAAFVQNSYEVGGVETNYAAVNGEGMAAYGNYNQNTTTPRDRIGMNPNMPKHEPEPTPTPTPEPEPKPIDPTPTPEPDPEPRPLPPAPEQRQLPPAPGVRGYLPVGREEERKRVIKPEPPVQKGEGVFVTPVPGPQIKGYLPIGRPELPPFEEFLPKEQDWPDLPHHETRALPMAGTPEFAITFEQAKNWKNWHAQLEKVKAKRQRNPQGTEAKELDTKRKNLEQRIQHLRNQLGGASDTQIWIAVTEAMRRGKLRENMAELQEKESINPKGGYAAPRAAQLEIESKELLKKIEELGGPDSLSEENRYYPTPIKGVQAKKKDLRNPNRLARQTINEPVEGEIEDIDFELIESKPKTPEDGQVAQQTAATQRNEQSEVARAFATASGRDGKGAGNRTYFTPETLKNLAENAKMLTEPLMHWHGTPVYLVDFDGKGNPVMQSREQPVVVANIGGFMVPFYLTTGLNANVENELGRWMPLYGLGYEGNLYTGIQTKTGEQYKSLQGLQQIADALNTKIGDIRNWRDNKKTKERADEGLTGFVGGCDAMPTMDAERVCDALYENTYDDRQIYGLHQGGDTEAFVMTSQDELAKALGEVGTTENKQQRKSFLGGISGVSTKAFTRMMARVNGSKQNRK